MLKSILRKIHKNYGANSLRSILIVTFISQITIVVGLVGFLSQNNAQKAVNEVVSQLRQEITQRIKQELDVYLKTPHIINSLNANAYALGQWDLEKCEKLERNFAHQIRLFPKTTYIYMGSKAQLFCGAERTLDGRVRVAEWNGKSSNPKFYTYETDALGRRIKVTDIDSNYDLLSRPWYQKAVKTGQASWGEVYIWAAPYKNLALPAVKPLYNLSGELEAVVAVDLSLEDIQKFLTQLEIGKTGKAFIIDRNGLLVATSTGESRFIMDDPEGNPQRLNVLNSREGIVKTTARYLKQRFGEYTNIDRSYQLEFSYKGQRQFLEVLPYQDELGLDWVIVLLVPEADFMETINANTRRTILLCVIALLLSVIATMLILRFLALPIERLSASVGAITLGEGNFKLKVQGTRELTRLASSFNEMISQLQNSFALLKKQNEQMKSLNNSLQSLKATQAKLVFENELLKATSLEEYQYQIGGTLPIDSPTYVVRKADKLLYKALHQGQFCYIFNARQMGKSSLRAKIMHQLSSEGYLCAALDLTEILSNDTTENQFYNSIIFNLAKKLGLLPEFNYRTWKKNLDYLSSLEKLGEFIEEIVLKKIQQKIIIFIDEIDAVLDLEFSVDRFFGFLRSLYNKRADRPEYRNLTIVLIGRTAPNYLIQSRESTPLNIGCGIPLEGFKLEEVSQSLMKGLQDNCDDPYLTIKEVLAWTGGQPFLTQKICNLIRESCPRINQGEEAELIAKLIETEIICDWENKDRPEHLKTISNNLTKNKHNPLRLLEKYREMLVIGSISDDSTIECLELFLSGIAVKKEEKLKIKNRIYETVFDRAWVDKEIELLSRSKPVV